MPKFGTYKKADAPQSGLGAFPSEPSNISQNTQPSADNVAAPTQVDVNAGPKVLSADEIYNILKSSKATS